MPLRFLTALFMSAFAAPATHLASTTVNRAGHLPWICGAALVLGAGLWAWTSGLSGPYHFDDYLTPVGDPASQSLEAWQHYLPVTLRPVTKLSYALEAQAGLAGDPAPRRVVSILLHAMTTGLLFLLIARLAPAIAPLGAALLAAIWFIHPVHADSILMLSGRTAVLSMAFLLAALLALDRSRSWLSALLFALACLSRETALAGLLPLVVLAASQPTATPRVVLRQIMPLLIASAIVLLWILTTPRYLHLAEYSFLGRPFWSSFASQVGAVPVGLRLLFKPAALSIDYGLPLPGGMLEPLSLLGGTMYIIAGVAILLLLRRSRVAAVGLAVWLAALLPTQSMIPKLDALTNRPLSLALAGLLLVAAAGLAAAWNWFGAPSIDKPENKISTGASAATRCVATGCTMALLLFLTIATARRAELFQSELNLWQDAAFKSITNAMPHMQYALLLKREGRDSEAWQSISVARSIDPFSSDIAAMSRTLKLKEVSQ